MKPFLKTKPYKHQADYLAHHIADKAHALLWRQRTGKTKAVIDSASSLWLAGKIDGVLILAPNGVHDNWVLRELPVHCAAPYIAYNWDSIGSHSKVEQKELQDLVHSGDEVLPFFAVNLESLISKRTREAIRQFIKNRNIMFVVDESHHFGKPGSRRTRLARGLAKKCTYRRILTGTPVHNSPLTAFSQYELLSPGALGFKTYAEFKRKYIVFSDSRWTNYKPEFQELNDLRERMSKYSSVVLREDCADLPDIIKVRRYFNLTLKQRKIYEEVKSGILIELDGKPDGGFDAAVGLMKAQQVTSGFLITTDERKVVNINGKDDPRLDALIDELLQSTEQAIIWCKFREEIRRVGKKLKQLGISFVEYHGGIPGDKRNVAVDMFQDKKVKIFLGQPRAGGHGLNLSSAGLIIWYSHTFDAVERDQASERATSIGDKPVDLIDLVAAKTVDEYILNCLDKKQHVSSTLAGKGLRDLLSSIL